MLFLLDKMSQTSRWNGLPLHEASSAVVSETLNGDFKLTMSYPLSDTLVYQLLETDKLIKSPAPLLGQQLFRIREVVEGDDAVEVTAYHITDDIMRRSIKPLTLHQVGCQTALSQVVTKSKSSLAPFSLSSDIASLHTFHTDKIETLYSVLMDGKHSLIGTWKGELVRDNFSLAIKARRGEDQGVVISTYKNLKRYERKQGSQSVITRIHLRSTIKEGEDDRVLSLTLDSPLIYHYPYIQEAEFENNNLKTLDELRQWGEAKFRYENIDKPSDAITIEAYELDGQAVHLGDWVHIKSRKHRVDLSKQAIGYEYNALTKQYISLTFDDKASVGGSSMSSPLSSFAKEVLGAANTAQELAIKEAVDNANRAFEQAFEKGKEELEEGIERANAKAEVVHSTVEQTIAGLHVLAQSLDHLETSWAVRTLTDSGTILSQLNVNSGGVKIQGRLIHLNGQTLIDNGVIKSAMIESLHGGKIVAGTITSTILASEAVTADKLKVDQAFFNKLMANEAYLKQLFAKQAFITQVQAVTLSANKISGGILTSLNKATTFDLNKGNISLSTDESVIQRLGNSTYPTQFLKFSTHGSAGGKRTALTVIGSNRNNGGTTMNANDGGFVGVRFWNGQGSDAVDVVGDTVNLSSSPYDNADGWSVTTLPGQLDIRPRRQVDERTSKIRVGDIWIVDGSGKYITIRTIIKNIHHSIQELDNRTGNRGNLYRDSPI